MDQFVIKVLLIGAFIVFALILLRRGSSARSQAIRTITLLAGLVAVILAVAFPEVVNSIAIIVGVGRGTDLLLYGLIVVFIASALTAARTRGQQDAQITQLARKMALQEPHYPDGERG